MMLHRVAPVQRCRESHVFPCSGRTCHPVSFAVKSDGSNSKVNERGKTSSRPGQVSQKTMRKEQAFEAAEKAAAAERQAATVVTNPPSSPTTSSQSAADVSAARVNQPSASASTPEPSLNPQSTPQVVVDRMFRRMVACAGAPVFLGLLSLPLFWYLKVVAKVEYPMWIVYAGQALTFGGGLLGITYGILSTSWDPTREGTFWGLTEVQANLPLLLNRNKK